MDKSTKLLEIATETIYLAGTAEMLDALMDKYDTTPPSADALEAVSKMLHEVTDRIRDLCDDLDKMMMEEEKA